jgi:hypothetical protein
MKTLLRMVRKQVNQSQVLGQWPDNSGINVKLWGRWWTSLLMVRSVDPSGGAVKLCGADKQYLPYRHRKKTPFIIENHPGALDVSGEWQLDRNTGVLKIIPRAGDDLSSMEVIAPVAERLLVLKGDAATGSYVNHVVFRGISFRYTNWTLTPDFTGMQADADVSAVIECYGSRNCLFEGCEVSQTDTSAIWLRRGTRECTVRQCHFYDLGAGGVKLGETQAYAQSDPLCTGGNTVENCYIHNAGHVHGSGGTGIWIGASSDNTVTHNEICDLWYTGIAVGWRWSADLNGTRNNRITYNYIHHIMQRLSDGGGIYTLGFQPQTVLANNIIHDSGRDGGPSHCRGIYMDEGSVGFLVENNLVYDTQDAALRMQIGTGCNVFINNILAYAREYAVDMDVARTCVFINNIVYLDQGRLFKFQKWPHYEKYISKNLYWRTDGQPFTVMGQSWDEWRKQTQAPMSYFKGQTMDQGSLVTDPQFVDAEKRDFRLKAGSKAFAIGFKPLDLAAPGLIGDENWTALPSRERTLISFEEGVAR